MQLAPDKVHRRLEMPLRNPSQGAVFAESDIPSAKPRFYACA
jgi:hypothetical protein